MEITELLQLTKKDFTVFDSIQKADGIINNKKYSSIICSISGGSDSDILLDLCTKIDKRNIIQYVFFETGIEYSATREHIKFLEEKYNIQIHTCRPRRPVPVCCKEFGQPFLSKQVSEWIARLQSHNFQWEDGDFETLYERYPNCKAALRWWCDKWGTRENGNISSYSIHYNKYLKDFMMENPPDFRISNKCCIYAKKDVAHKAIKMLNADLNIIGVRRYEGGARATAYKTCFSFGKGGVDQYRLIFWYKNEDKEFCNEVLNIQNSRFYTEYGLQRTGCAGCPYGRNVEEELNILREYEPNLYKAVNVIFGDSYEYTRKYREYVAKRLAESNQENI